MAHTACPFCGAPVDALRARALGVIDGRIVPFCSEECKERGPRRVTSSNPTVAARRRPWRMFAIASGAVVLVGGLLGVRVSFEGRPAKAALPTPPAATAPVAAPAPPPVKPEDVPYGPELPPAGLFAEGDAWFHPLPGPLRRLPDNPTRRFGAARDHDSPESCREGHCGCDIGQVKGEPVLAVHDGVVERVQRDEHASGGRYVRLLHRNGTVVTQYFHLDEIDEKLQPGMHVRAGDPIGTLGDTGVFHAGPHLHFTVATKANEKAPEVYIDPEPLLTLWPLFQR